MATLQRDTLASEASRWAQGAKNDPSLIDVRGLGRDGSPDVCTREPDGTFSADRLASLYTSTRRRRRPLTERIMA